MSSGPSESDARDALIALRTEVAKAVVGQDAAVSGLVVALLCEGHVLLEGVPGVAKTLLVRTLSRTLDLESKRVQFTPDLMPSDITGSLVFDSRSSGFDFRAGPVFTNVLLADEINRTPPKTQAALLEAMEERQVTVEGEARPLPHRSWWSRRRTRWSTRAPTRCPRRSSTDSCSSSPSRCRRARTRCGYLPCTTAVSTRATSARAGVRAVTGAAGLAAARAGVAGVRVEPEMLGYIVDIVRATRVAPSLSLGVSPRGATALLAAAKAWAWLSGRDYCTPDDVKALARPALRHRVTLRPEAELEGVTADSVLDSVLATVAVPR